MSALQDIREIEERALNAWPSLRTVLVCGWELRLSGGFTKRANSANALAPHGSFDLVKAQAESIFSRSGLPPIFRISPVAPPEADQILESSGYRYFDPSIIMTAPLTDMELPATCRIDLAPTKDWLEGFASANQVAGNMRALHDAIVNAIALPTAFITILHRQEPVGYALAVLERSYVGLFDIVVLPEARGLGFGRILTQTAMCWGRKAGAEKAYLAVRGANKPAINLYSSLGFEEYYSYHYRIPAK
jgi:N-acetylglutamate synthase